MDQARCPGRGCRPLAWPWDLGAVGELQARRGIWRMIDRPRPRQRPAARSSMSRSTLPPSQYSSVKKKMPREQPASCIRTTLRVAAGRGVFDLAEE